MKRLNSLLDDFTTLFSGFYASLFLYSEVGREEGKKMCSKLALADDTAYIYIHLHCCVSKLGTLCRIGHSQSGLALLHFLMYVARSPS
jgi:hypothetical protein